VPYLLHGGNMANEISYGLKFNTKDMERLIKLAEQLDKQYQKTINLQTNNAKVVTATNAETSAIEKKTTALKEEAKAKAYANKLALENINLDIKRSKTQWKATGISNISGQYGDKYKLTGFKQYDATVLAQKKANIDLLKAKIDGQKLLEKQAKTFNTEMLNIDKQYLKASKQMTEGELNELYQTYVKQYTKIKGLTNNQATQLANQQILLLLKKQEEALRKVKPPTAPKPLVDPMIAKTAFAEKELVNLKKQSLMMNKKLTKSHLSELEGLYKHYYTNIKHLDQKAADQLTKQQIDNIKQRQKINSNITNVPVRVAKYLATSTLVYQGLGALKTGRDAIIDYDQALNDTYMAIGKVTEADKELLKTITQNSEYTQKYGKSFVELAKSMEVLIKAGFNVSESTAILEPSLQLAAAGGMELEEAAKALTQSLRNMGRPMGDAQEMADLLASAAAGSAIDVKDLITSLQGAGAVAKNFGTNSKELITWLGAMGNVGLKGKEAGNAFNRVWLRLTKLTPQVEKLYALKGIKLYDDADKLRKFTDIINDVANASISLQDKQKLLGIHALKSADQIMSALPSYSQLAVVMENVSGSAEKMAGMKMEGLQSEIDKMKGTWDNIFVTQNGITESMRLMAKYLTGALETFANNPALTKAILTLGAGGSAALFTPGGAIAKAAAGGFAAGGMLATVWDSDSDKVKDAMAKLAKEKTKTEAEAKVFREREEDLKAMTLDDLKEELKLLSQKSKLIEKDAIFYKKKADEQTAWIYKNQEQLTVANQESTWKDIEKLDAKSAGKRNELTPISLEINAVRALIGQFEQKSLMDDGGNKTPKNQKELKDRYKSPILQFRKLEQEPAMQTLPKYLADIAKVELDAFEKKEKQKQELMETYDTFTQLQKLSQQEQELLLLADSEEAKYSIRVEYAEKTGELLSTQYEKEHQITSAFWQSVKAGQQSFTNSLIDMDMTGKERREAIWTSFRDFFLKAIIDMAIKYMIFAAITNLIPGGFEGGLGGMIGKIFGVGAGSFSLDDAVVADGKVYPYRKDDLVMIGTNLDNRSGATLPTQSMVNGGGSKNDNSSMVSAINSLRLAVARSDANNVKAITDNTPVVQGTMMDNVKIYKASEIGKRKANFIVNPT